MRTKVICPFTLPSSHDIHEVEFRGDNKLKLKLPFKRENFLGCEGTSLEIVQTDEGKYNFIVISHSLESKEEQVEYLERAAEFISFLINRNEHNPHYGTNFVQIEWFELKATSVDDNGEAVSTGIRISDSLSISSTRTVSLSDGVNVDDNYHEMLRFYFDGLRAEHRKSKYFHWFLILEHLEHSNRYEAMFLGNKLFDESESAVIKDAADKMNDGVKKGALLNLLSRTKEFRNDKLFKILKELGIESISWLGKSTPVSVSHIKQITDGRNALFHCGSNFPEEVLWGVLFPLATLIVERVASDPACLNV